MSRVIYEIWEVDRPNVPDMRVAICEGQEDRARAEAQHYALVYGQDGPVAIKGPIRRDKENRDDTP